MRVPVWHEGSIKQKYKLNLSKTCTQPVQSKWSLDYLFGNQPILLCFGICIKSFRWVNYPQKRVKRPHHGFRIYLIISDRVPKLLASLLLFLKISTKKDSGHSLSDPLTHFISSKGRGYSSLYIFLLQNHSIVFQTLSFCLPLQDCYTWIALLLLTCR